MYCAPTDVLAVLRIRANARIRLPWITERHVFDAYIAEALAAVVSLPALRRRVARVDGRTRVFLGEGEDSNKELRRDFSELARIEAMLDELGDVDP